MSSYCHKGWDIPSYGYRRGRHHGLAVLESLYLPLSSAISSKTIINQGVRGKVKRNQGVTVRWFSKIVHFPRVCQVEFFFFNLLTFPAYWQAGYFFLSGKCSSKLLLAEVMFQSYKYLGRIHQGTHQWLQPFSQYLAPKTLQTENNVVQAPTRTTVKRNLFYSSEVLCSWEIKKWLNSLLGQQMDSNQEIQSCFFMKNSCWRSRSLDCDVT